MSDRPNLALDLPTARRVESAAEALAWNCGRVCSEATTWGLEHARSGQLATAQDPPHTLERQVCVALEAEALAVAEELAAELDLDLAALLRRALLIGLRHVERLAAAVVRVHGGPVGPTRWSKLARKDTRSARQRARAR
ncbi:MAG: hypothetical protein AB7N76_19030 [Planctomycetota bacterium]